MIVLIPGPLFGQVIDNFTDGNFSQDPPWSGNAGSFIVNADLHLQLDANEEGSAALFTPVQVFEEMEWRFWVREAFSPSANNHARIYLLAQSAQTMNMPDGVFVQLGESGSNDAIRLMVQEDGDTSTLICGDPGAIASSFNCSVRVIREADSWRLFADYEGGNNFQDQGSCSWNPAPATLYLGVYCKYTASNSKKFYFDNFYAGPRQYDTTPPLALGTDLASPVHVVVIFSEYLDSHSAEDNTKYLIDGGVGYPASALQNEDDPARVGLHFSDSLPYGKLLQLNMAGISDVSGNVMRDTSLQFSRYNPRRYDVVINEIMADPTPAVQLPEYEYLELFNTTPLPLNLTGWTLILGAGKKALTGAHIEPGGYLIIGKVEAEAQLKTYGSFFGLESFSLTNSGQDLMLINKEGEPMSSVCYEDGWYGDEEKAEGGWSLEQINPYNPCLLSENWKATENYKGGSPGAENSVFDNYFIAPEIIRVCAIDSVRISVQFSQTMPNNFTLSPQIFSIDHGAGPIMAILPEDLYFTSFILYPKKKLYPGYIYGLSCKAEILNCVGDTTFITGIYMLGLPAKPLFRDLVINEVLFNPFPGGGDYVEIYNRSDKAISLGGILLGSVKHKPPAPPDTTFSQIRETCHVMMPGEYALLCKDYSDVDKFYICSNTKNHLELDDFPAYSNEQGMVLLQDEKANILDAFSYHEDMHYPLLNMVEGVALERLHPDRLSADPTNWHSASQLSGFGTPGYKNSQFMEAGSEKESIIISPKVCRPGYDGLVNQIGIHYRLDRPGYLASIMIFNAAGQLVRQLVNNELLGSSGAYSWNGIYDNNSRAPAGMYVILIELTDVGGKIVRYKKTAIVAPGL